MSQIRRQSIISTFFVYTGFFIGFINTYLFTKEGLFTPADYALTGFFIAVGNIIFSASNMGMPAYLYKFFPYYQDNLDLLLSQAVRFEEWPQVALTLLAPKLNDDPSGLDFSGEWSSDRDSRR